MNFDHIFASISIGCGVIVMFGRVGVWWICSLSAKSTGVIVWLLFACFVCNEVKFCRCIEKALMHKKKAISG